MKVTLIVASALGAAAFPHLMDRDILEQIGSQLSRRDALGISAAESNCGTRSCPTFDAEGMLGRG